MRRTKAKAPIPDAVRRPCLPADPTIVRRARFTDSGEVIEESSFSTETELAGRRGAQAPLPMGCGERPVETAGPLFAQEVK